MILFSISAFNNSEDNFNCVDCEQDIIIYNAEDTLTILDKIKLKDISVRDIEEMMNSTQYSNIYIEKTSKTFPYYIIYSLENHYYLKIISERQRIC